LNLNTSRAAKRGRLVAIAATLALVSPLAACAADAPAADNGEVGGEIRYQTYQGPDQVAVWDEQWIDLEERTGVSVVTETVPNAEQSQRLLTQAASGDLPDVAMISARFFNALASRGLLEPLSEENLPGVDFDDLQPVLLEAYQYDGVQYGVPTDLDTGLLFYNKDIFDAAGQEYPNPDWTWEEFQQVAAELTVGEGAGKQFGADISGAGNWGVIEAVAASYGGSLFDQAAGVPTVDAGGGRAAVELFDQMLRVDQSTPAPGTENAQIGNGQIAMGIYGPWAAYYYLNGVDFAWDVTTLPQGDQSATFGWGSVLVVFSDSENKASALAFVENFLSEELQTQRAVDWAWTPPSISLLEDPAFGESDALAMTAEQKLVVAAALENAVPPVILQDQPRGEQVLQEVLSEMAAGSIDAEQAIQRLTEGWAPLIAE
jgi:multiple sugar transport system substrate-binding protein